MASIYSSKNPPPHFYVYAYLRKDSTPYYIGKGTYKRAWNHFKNEVPKPPDTSRIKILEANLSELGAFALERRYISWYGRKDNNTGILRNKTDGGEGPVGRRFIMTDSHKKNLSKAKAGKVPSCTYTRRTYADSNNPKAKKCKSPEGIIYSCAKDAAIILELGIKRVQYYCRNNIYGWSYI